MFSKNKKSIKFCIPEANNKFSIEIGSPQTPKKEFSFKIGRFQRPTKQISIKFWRPTKKGQ